MDYAREQEKKRSPEMTKYENLSDDQTVLDVFRHVDFNYLRIYIVPETKEIYKGKEDLEAFLQKPNLNIEECIQKGIKFTFSKTHIWQNSHFQSLIFDKIHIFQTSNKSLVFAPVC